MVDVSSPGARDVDTNGPHLHGVRFLECRVCSSIRELGTDEVTCPCRRSSARITNGAARLSGPGRILIAIEVEGPEEPRRSVLVTQDLDVHRTSVEPLL